MFGGTKNSLGGSGKLWQGGHFNWNASQILEEVYCQMLCLHCTKTATAIRRTEASVKQIL